MGVEWDIDQVLLRRNSGHLVAVESDQAVSVMLSVPDGAGSVSRASLLEEFTDSLGERRLNEVLQTLLRRKLLREDETGAYTRSTPWMPFHRKLIAVELKLKRVEEVLNQAKRHLTITPHSFVALPPAIAARLAASSKADEFRLAGVGLVAASNGTCEELIAPSFSGERLDRVFEIAAAEKCWTKIRALKAI